MQTENFFGMKRVRYFSANLAIFLFFALFLSVPHAYSITALLIFLICIWAIPAWKTAYSDRKVRHWIWYFLCVAFFWAHSFDCWWSWSLEGDMPTKYALAAIFVLGASTLQIRPKVMIYALALGCISTFIVAILQFCETGKATGYTNAIRFGDIAILMGGMCWCFFLVRELSIYERIFLFFAGCMGVLASLLSLSRGGWPLLLVAPLVIYWGFFRNQLSKAWLATAVCAVAVLGGLSVWAIRDVPALNQRVAAATQEVRGYFTDRKQYVNTSVGVRLEQWRMSWMLGSEQPLTGWGDHGVWEGRKQYVERGVVDASVLQIAHTHNEFLEIWARRGIIGVIFLALIYIVPFYLFLPRDIELSRERKSLYVALHVAGMMVPVGYFIFGLSEVFFFMNIGNMFFIFSLVFIFSAIKWMEQEQAKL